MKLDKSQTGARLQAIRQKEQAMAETMGAGEAGELSRKVDALKRDLADVAAAAKTKVVDDTTQWAKEHPAAAIGIVAGLAGAIGFALGMLVGRNRS